jgi:hypothetical protein
VLFLSIISGTAGRRRMDASLFQGKGTAILNDL